jgi:hypothetical protein
MYDTFVAFGGRSVSKAAGIPLYAADCCHRDRLVLYPGGWILMSISSNDGTQSAFLGA